ncbi:cellulase (glycosyl hydrolase family 5) domain-containing protein [Sarocladium implicatum]|nr:cellulase (glycosyl hydrolase family 5) domain-containing protein [Sarocladium implicatum]
MRFLAFLLVASGLILPALAQTPALPLSSSSRWIVDSNGDRVKLRCINWAGHMEVNIPEGLHKQPIAHIADWIAGEGFNCVRLTFAIDMALNPDLRVEDSFRGAAEETGVDEGELMRLYEDAVKNNGFLADASIRDVFGAVQDALWERNVMTVLDNHVSKASWCCNLDDGNGWWSDARFYEPNNSRFFDTDQWLQGLESIAQWSADRPGVVAISLRNELRATWTQIPFAPDAWFDYMPRAARLVHAANPNALVIVGGINGGTDLSPLRSRAMDTGDWAGKNVWEVHMYSYTITTPNFGSCDVEKVEYGALFGFVLEQDRGDGVTGPLFLGEFGVGMQGGDREDGFNQEDYDYLTCLVGYLEGNDADWSHWAVQGTYYVRDGRIDYDETWGALDKDWNNWRNPAFKGLLGRLFEVSQGPGV